MGLGTLDEINRLREENARLTGERNDAVEMHKTCHKERDEARAEVVHLRALVKSREQDTAEHLQTIKGLATEVARLEGLIRDALSCDPAIRPVEWVEWRIRAAKGE